MMILLIPLPIVDDLFVFLHLDPIVVDKNFQLIILLAKFILVLVLNMTLMCELRLEIASSLLLILMRILQLFVKLIDSVLS